MRRRIVGLAVAGMAVFAGGLPAGAQGAVADECKGSPQPALCHGAAVIRRDLTPIDPATVTAAERGSTARDLVFQHHLGDTVPFADAPWAGTHNSFNSIAELGPALSSSDANQRVTMVDQLRMGIRSLEVDVHLIAGRPTVCHGAEPGHVGCTVEGPLAPVLARIATWMRAHPSEVVLLYLEDHLDTVEGYAAGTKIVRDTLGSLLYAPAPGDAPCRSLPLDLTRKAVLEAGHQIVAIGNCAVGSAWNGAVYDFAKIKHEGRVDNYQPAPVCDSPTPEEAAKPIQRFFEDSTFVSAATGSTDQGLTPETIHRMLGCGVDLFGIDQLVPGDPKLDALVWTWAPDEPRAADCSMQLATSRWAATSCLKKRRAACLKADGSWVVPKGTTTYAKADRLCRRAKATLSTPRTFRENAALRAAAGTRTTWLAVRPR